MLKKLVKATRRATSNDKKSYLFGQNDKSIN